MNASSHAKQTILFVTNKLSFFLSHRKEIAFQCIKVGYRVLLVAEKDADVKQLTDAGIEFFSIETNRNSSLGIADLKFFINLMKVIRINKPDLIHYITIKPVLLGGLLARLMNVPAVVFAISGLGSVFVGKTFIKRLRRFFVFSWYKLIFRHPNLKAIFQNDFDQRLLTHRGALVKEQIEFIPGSGVDLALYNSKPNRCSEKLSVLFAGRLLLEKGIGDFLEAARLLRIKELPVTFYVAGEPDNGNPSSLSSIVLSKAQAEGDVELLGFVADMPSLLKDVDVFCYPSYYGEGVPKVLLEACAAGLPIITTDHPGCRDVVSDGVNGVLIPPHSPQLIVDAVQMFLERPGMCDDYGRASRDKAVAKYDVRDVVNSHLNIYKSLMD
jgi:glycosyltransferase involved in cell wall biosynthesis